MSGGGRTDGARPLRIAHRAGNRRSSLKRALAAGVDWLETDVWWCAGRIVARHEKRFGRLPILYDKWKIGLAFRALELPELCRSLPHGPHLFLDLKGQHAALPRAIVQTLRDLGSVDVSVLCGQVWPLLDAARTLEPRLRVCYSLETERQLTALRRRHGVEPAVQAASVWEGLLTARLIAELHERGMKVLAWTVNDGERARELVAAGIDGVISDRLDLLAGLDAPPRPAPAAGA